MYVYLHMCTYVRMYDVCMGYALVYDIKFVLYLAYIMCLQIDEALLCLATAQNLEGVPDLYFNHSRDVIQTFKVWNDYACMHMYVTVHHWQETYKNWSVHSTDCYMFGSLLSGAGPVLGQLLDDVIPILSYCLNAEEPELRLQYVT